MGRGKLKLELIPNPGQRMLTFKKRKDCLKKKLKELTTLCDVNASMIIYGPDRAVEPEIYPDNLYETCRIIADYNSKKGDSTTKCKSFGLSDFFAEKKAKEEEVEAKVKYPTWNETLESVQDPLVLKKFADELNVKAQMVKSRIDLLKQEKAVDMSSSSSSTCTDMQQYNYSGGGLASSFQQQPHVIRWPELQPQDFHQQQPHVIHGWPELQPQDFHQQQPHVIHDWPQLQPQDFQMTTANDYPLSFQQQIHGWPELQAQDFQMTTANDYQSCLNFPMTNLDDFFDFDDTFSAIEGI